MKYYFLLIFVAISITGFSQGQRRGQHGPPVLKEISDLSVIKLVYPNADTQKKENAYWNKIVDAKGKVLGYALNSRDYCKDVKGHANTTPVLIVTDKKLVIQKVSMLSNYETESYVAKLTTAGFFNKWNNKEVSKAKLETVDGYTGATRTAMAVVKNVNFLLENGAKLKPKK